MYATDIYSLPEPDELCCPLQSVQDHPGYSGYRLQEASVGVSSTASEASGDWASEPCVLHNSLEGCNICVDKTLGGQQLCWPSLQQAMQ